MFRHEPEADRRRGRDSWTHANRAAVPFRVGAREGRSLALPLHISSRAKARRDREESSEAVRCGTLPLRGVMSRMTTRRFLPCFFSAPAALGGLKLLRLTAELIRWKSDDPSAWLFFL